MNLSKPTLVGLKPNDEDWRLILKLVKFFGVDRSQVLRMAIRELARKEGVAA